MSNRRGMTRLTHPDVEDDVLVVNESLEVWLDSGWSVVDDGSEQDVADVPVNQPASTGELDLPNTEDQNNEGAQ